VCACLTATQVNSLTPLPQTCITLADFGCSVRERNLDGYTGLELLEKMKKSNNELGQVCCKRHVASHMPHACITQA